MPHPPNTTGVGSVERVATALYVGVDGGGSKTEAWVGAYDASASGGIAVLGRGMAPASNLKQVGLELAVKRVCQAVGLACEDAGLTGRALSYGHVALAGAGNAAERRLVEVELARTGLAMAWGVSDDARAPLAAGRHIFRGQGGAPPDAAVVLIGGTGSMAWGTDGRGRTARAGGLGPTFGDEGSGYAIGLAAVRQACRAVEQRGPGTGLLGIVLKQLGLASAADLLEWCRAGDPPRRTVAALAEPVIQSAAHDPHARAIVDQAISDLASLVGSVQEQLNHTAPAPWMLVLAGGVLVHHQVIREGIASQLARDGLAPLSIVTVAHPALGALVTAADSARSA